MYTGGYILKKLSVQLDIQTLINIVVLMVVVTFTMGSRIANVILNTPSLTLLLLQSVG